MISDRKPPMGNAVIFKINSCTLIEKLGNNVITTY